MMQVYDHDCATFSCLSVECSLNSWQLLAESYLFLFNFINKQKLRFIQRAIISIS